MAIAERLREQAIIAIVKPARPTRAVFGIQVGFVARGANNIKDVWPKSAWVACIKLLRGGRQTQQTTQSGNNEGRRLLGTPDNLYP